jgi:hypothetical protein
MAPNADCLTQPLTSLAATNIPVAAPDHVLHFKPTTPWTPAQLSSHLKTALGALLHSPAQGAKP